MWSFQDTKFSMKLPDEISWNFQRKFQWNFQRKFHWKLPYPSGNHHKNGALEWCRHHTLLYKGREKPTPSITRDYRSHAFRLCKRLRPVKRQSLVYGENHMSRLRSRSKPRAYPHNRYPPRFSGLYRSPKFTFFNTKRCLGQKQIDQCRGVFWGMGVGV